MLKCTDVFPLGSDNSDSVTAFDCSAFIGSVGRSNDNAQVAKFGLGGGMSVCHIHSFDSDRSSETNKS